MHWKLQRKVAWGIAANHGGGYQYRLCPADADPTEECFQKTPLDFVGEDSWRSRHFMNFTWVMLLQIHNVMWIFCREFAMYECMGSFVWSSQNF